MMYEMAPPITVASTARPPGPRNRQVIRETDTGKAYKFIDMTGVGGGAVWLEAHLYPVTIMRTRYGGAYENGEWAAFLAYSVPDDAQGGDGECMDWWDAARVRGSDWWHRVGVGASPGEALAALEAVAPEDGWQ